MDKSLDELRKFITQLKALINFDKEEEVTIENGTAYTDIDIVLLFYKKPDRDINFLIFKNHGEAIEYYAKKASV